LSHADRSAAQAEKENTVRIAITGGTGFVGRHLARLLTSEGHEVVLIARGADKRDLSIRKIPNVVFFQSDLSDPRQLNEAISGCDSVAHCAGINREIGEQTYQKVHVEGTQHLVEAARRAGVRKIVLLSFLRARPNCGSAYHESKWTAEEVVRACGLDYTVIKAGMIYGQGDSMLDHLSHSLYTLRCFATVGFSEQPIRPLAIEDLLRVLRGVLVELRVSRETVMLVGPEELRLSEAVGRVGVAIGKRPLIVPAPVWLHYLLAPIFEFAMKVPLVAKAQVRILAEGVVDVAPFGNVVAADLLPRRMFTLEQIRKGLPPPGGFGLTDLRNCRSALRH
jgi:uncharacterized protein YbjT (DUF2867 family)